MKKIMCSFGTNEYKRSLDLLEKTTYEVGKIDKFYKYNREWLETTEFYKKNQYILDKKRGSGFFSWKTAIIIETFNHLDEGDIVLYSDAAMEVIGDLTPLYNTASSIDGIMLFLVPGFHLNKMWTKKDCFSLMKCDSPIYHNARQSQGALSLWVKNEKTIEFLNEWAKIMRDPRVITDDPNFCGPNHPEFIDHRHDQSILSLLRIKHNIEVYRDPTQFGNSEIDQFDNSPYPQLFNHHRQKL